MTTAYTRDELRLEEAALLPAREALFALNLTLNLANIVAVNPAIAVNAATIGSSATAIATQVAGLGGLV